MGKALMQGFKKKLLMEFFNSGGGSAMGRFSTKKNKKNKDDQNGLICPENRRLTFLLLGVSGQIFGLIV